MKRILMVCLVLLTPSLWADERSKAAKADELVQLLNLEATQQASMETVLEQFSAKSMSKMLGMNLSPEMEQRLQRMEADLNKMFSEALDWKKLKPIYAQIYAEAYSEEELEGILTFYRSPAGKAMVAQTPLVTKKSVAVSQEMMVQLQPKLQEYMKKSMQEIATPKQQ